MSDSNQYIIEENKRLKDEIETYQKGYENILTEKLLLEQEFENYKLAIEESKKIKNPGIYGSTTVLNIASENAKYESEIDQYLNTIWELQTTLSLKEEEIRILNEKNKKLENDLKNLQEQKKEEENKEEKEDKKNEKKMGIFNIRDLYSSL